MDGWKMGMTHISYAAEHNPALRTGIETMGRTDGPWKWDHFAHAAVLLFLYGRSGRA
jgi:hypothetical protein